MFQAFAAFQDNNLRLPILLPDGTTKTYVIPGADAELGLYCQRMMAVTAKLQAGGDLTDDDVARVKLNDEEEEDLYHRLLGHVWDEMFADKIPWRTIQRVGATVLTWTVYGEPAAEELWNDQGKALVDVLTPSTGPDPAPADSPSSSKRKSPTKKAAAGSTSSSTGT